MYRYEYETVSCEFGGWGLGSGNVYTIETTAPSSTAARRRAGGMWAASPPGSGARATPRRWI